MKYGRDRGRRLAPPSAIPTAQSLFRQALLGPGSQTAIDQRAEASLDARVSIWSGILLGQVGRVRGRIVADVFLVTVEADVVGRAVRRPGRRTKILRRTLVLSRFRPLGSSPAPGVPAAPTASREAEEYGSEK
jgi:hypothetical protein